MMNVDSGRFDELRAELAAVHGLTVPWCVAGGWAIDLWAGRVTRSHHDVDLLVARSDQRAIYDHFRNRNLTSVTPHPDGRVGEGTLETWGGEWLDLPIHQVFADDDDGKRIEILLGEMAGGRWAYRRNPEATLPLGDLIVTGPTGIPALAPEVVLLFKAKLMRSWDEVDFDTVLPILSGRRRAWLAEALDRSHTGNPWIERLR